MDLRSWSKITVHGQYFLLRPSQALQLRSKWSTGQKNLTVNTLVLIQEPTPPLCWKLGRITEVHPRQDGVVRVATVKTATGCIQRGQHVHTHNREDNTHYFPPHNLTLIISYCYYNYNYYYYYSTSFSSLYNYYLCVYLRLHFCGFGFLLQNTAPVTHQSVTEHETG